MNNTTASPAEVGADVSLLAGQQSDVIDQALADAFGAWLPKFVCQVHDESLKVGECVGSIWFLEQSDGTLALESTYILLRDAMIETLKHEHPDPESARRCLDLLAINQRPGFVKVVVIIPGRGSFVKCLGVVPFGIGGEA